ncbi:MAG: nucleoside hydrolase [Alphaproteobacteria bacterium]
MTTPIIIDCDPGNDDAVAISVAIASPEDFDIRGITTVAGNVDVEQIAINAMKICELAGRPDIPVYKGARRPLVREEIFADMMHGETGLDGSTMPEPTMKLQEKHACSFLIDHVMQSNEKITVLATGPLTNIALALVQEPAIKDNIERIIIMGGSMSTGNITAAAEFNMYADPHAAHVVFTSGMDISLIGLDVSHQLIVTAERSAQMRALGNPVGAELANILEFTAELDIERYGLTGRAVHDVLVPIFASNPQYFKGAMMPVDVEIHSERSMGNTIVGSYPGMIENPNVFVVTDIDEAAVFEHIMDRLSRFSGKTLAVAQ